MRAALTVLSAAALFLIVLVGLDTSAQVIDSNPCRASCEEQKAACVGDCSSRVNTVECESGCDVDLEECLRHCH
jgi:hypothetical protein